VKGVDREENEDGELEVKMYADSLTAVQAIERPDYQRAARRSSQPDQWYVQNCGAGFYALGIFGQEVQVFPEENLIFVRLGERWDTPTRQLITKIRSLLEPMN
jgi:CubicO group peptidase (beta-lactamase class C family)